MPPLLGDAVLGPPAAEQSAVRIARHVDRNAIIPDTLRALNT